MSLDHTWLTLRALLEGELDDHPLMPEVRLYCSRRRWPKPAALIAAAGLLMSCAHPVLPEAQERAWVTVETTSPNQPLTVPDKPLEGQSVAPCEEFETEIRGGCWVEVPKGKRKDGTCSPKLSAWSGGCYLPVKKPTPVPRSITP